MMRLYGLQTVLFPGARSMAIMVLTARTAAAIDRISHCRLAERYTAKTTMATKTFTHGGDAMADSANAASTPRSEPARLAVYACSAGMPCMYSAVSCPIGTMAITVRVNSNAMIA